MYYNLDVSKRERRNMTVLISFLVTVAGTTVANLLTAWLTRETRKPRKRKPSQGKHAKRG